MSHWSRLSPSSSSSLHSFSPPSLQIRCGCCYFFLCVCAWLVVFVGLVLKILSLFPSKAAPQHGPLRSSVTGRRGKSALWIELWFQLWSDMVHSWLKSHVVPQGGCLLVWSGLQLDRKVCKVRMRTMEIQVTGQTYKRPPAAKSG